MNKWLVMVDATKYNLFGAVRKYGDGIPWFFDGTTGAEVGDKVLFYLTDSKASGDKGYENKSISSLYKRVVFEGVITEVGADLKKADIDAEYWDKKHAEDTISTCKELVVIKIEKALYDDKITSKDFDNDIWMKNQKTYVVKIE